MFYKKNYDRIGVNTDDNVPLNKKLKFPALTISIRCVFEESSINVIHKFIQTNVCMNHKNIPKWIVIIVIIMIIVIIYFGGWLLWLLLWLRWSC